MTVTLRLGSMIALQEETHGFRLMDKLALVVLIQESASTAKDLPRRRPLVWLSTTETARLGLISAIQLRIPLLKRTQVVQALMIKELVAHSQVLELNAKDLLKENQRA